MAVGMGSQLGRSQEPPDTPDWVRRSAGIFKRYLDLNSRIQEQLGVGEEPGSLRRECDCAILESVRSFMLSRNDRLPEALWISTARDTQTGASSKLDRFYLPQAHEICCLREPGYLDLMEKLHPGVSDSSGSSVVQNALRDDLYLLSSLYHPAGKNFIGFDRIKALIPAEAGERDNLPIMFLPVTGISSPDRPLAYQMNFEEIYRLFDNCLPDLDDNSRGELKDLKREIQRKVGAYNEVLKSLEDSFGAQMKEVLDEFIASLSPQVWQEMGERIEIQSGHRKFSFSPASMRLFQEPSSASGADRKDLTSLIRRFRMRRAKETPAREWLNAAPLILQNVASMLDPRHALAIDSLVALRNES